MGQWEAGAAVCLHACACMCVFVRACVCVCHSGNRSKHFRPIALYWWIFMPLASMSAFMWTHVSGCSLLQNVWVCFSRRRLNDAEWNMCFARSVIESKGPLIALPHHSVSATNPCPPPPMHMLHTHPSPLQTVLEGPDKRSIKGLFLNESVFTNDSCSHPFALAIYSPHPLSPPFYTGYMFSIILLSIPMYNKHWGRCDAKCFLAVIGVVLWWYVCLCVLLVWTCWGGGKAGLLCILSLI